jgi:hypothetical protein
MIWMMARRCYENLGKTSVVDIPGDYRIIYAIGGV